MVQVDDSGITSYTIKVKTGNDRKSGTDCKVEIKIVGSKNETSFFVLDEKLHNDFERGSIQDYNIKDIDVGDIEYLMLNVSQKFFDLTEPNWYIDYIFVTKNLQSVPENQKSNTRNYFPVYQWITKQNHGREIFVATNKSCIPHLETERRKGSVRNGQVKKQTIEWSPDRFADGLPGSIKGTESDHDWNLKFTDGKDRNFQKNRLEALKSRIEMKVISKFLTLDSIDDFGSLIPKHHPKVPEWVLDNQWTKDEEFGREILNGTSPAAVSRCRTLPANFKVNNEHVANSLGPETTLEKELEKGTIYIVNHEILKDISTGTYEENKIELPAAMCLFHVTDQKEFKPIAIQLGQNPNDPIWTPKDDYYAWMLAKMWFKNADIQVHQMNVHLAFTHLIMEPFAIAMFRCLPPVHPIHKLLRESLQFVIAINTVGRTSLISKGGAADAALSIGHGSDGMVELLQKSFENLDLECALNFSKSIEKRDVSDIPNYHYRDDGLMIWSAIENYVEEIIDAFYGNDKDVKDDIELQEWVSEISTNGFSGLKGVNEKRYESELLTLDGKNKLLKLCTMIMFTSSAQHAAVNFLQWDYFCFAPNGPTTMLGKIPKEEDRGNITKEYVIQSLPDAEISATAASLSLTLSDYSGDEVYLLHEKNKQQKSNQNLGADTQSISIGKLIEMGNLPPRYLFTEQDNLDVYMKFQKSLLDIENKIEMRNKDLKYPYDVLLPSKVPCGIAI